MRGTKWLRTATEEHKEPLAWQRTVVLLEFTASRAFFHVVSFALDQQILPTTLRVSQFLQRFEYFNHASHSLQASNLIVAAGSVVRNQTNKHWFSDSHHLEFATTHSSNPLGTSGPSSSTCTSSLSLTLVFPVEFEKLTLWSCSMHLWNFRP